MVKDIRFKISVDTADITRANNELKAQGTVVDSLGDKFEKTNKDFKSTSSDIQRNARENSNSIKGMGTAMGGLENTVKNVGKGIIAAFAVSKILDFGKQIIETTAQFQKLEAVLTNTLGSQSKAQKALGDIKSFAAVTNFGVAELTSAFVKLANQGFTPTTQEMTKLADLANSTGKTFDMLTEAIIDAQVGEFERLKEFGIRASKEGDKVAFTFKGVKTQVDFTSESIQNYILGLGDLQGVTGATAAISETLGGKVSNLGDAYDNLVNSIGARLNTFLKTSTGLATQLADAIAKALTPQSELDNAAQANKIKGQQLLIEKEIYSVQTKARYETGRYFTKEEAAQIILNKEYSKNLEIQEKLDGAQIQVNIARKGTIKRDLAEKELARETKILEISNERIRLLEVVNFGEEKGNQAQAARLGLIEKIKNEIEAISKAKPDMLSEGEIRKANIQLKKLQDELSRLNKLGLEDQKAYYNAELQFLNRHLDDKLDAVKDKGEKTIEELEKIYQTSADEIGKITDISTQEQADMFQFQLSEYEKMENAKTEKTREQIAARQQIERTATQLAFEVANGLFELESYKRDEALMDIKVKKEQELSIAGDNKQQQALINNKFAQKEREIKIKQAQADKNQALFNIAMNTAVAVVKALPNFVLASLVGALGAVQLGVASSRPLPKFNKGTKSVPGIDTGDDSVLAMLRPKEGVMPVDRMNDYRPAFDAIFDRKVPPELINGMVMNYGKLGKATVLNSYTNNTIDTDRIIRAIEKKQETHIKIDKNGIKTYIENGFARTEFVNNYFDR